MLEEERKFAVEAGFEMPDLTGCLPSGGRVVPRPPMTLRATYYDTPDLRLARAGVSRRSGRGEAPAGRRKATGTWTAKLPTETTGIRQEISRSGPNTAPPADLVSLLTAYHRGEELRPAAAMRTVRRVYDLRDRSDRLL